MNLERAVEILERLRDGEDPVTGRALPKESPCQSPDVVRSLYTVLAALPDGGGDASGEPAETPPKPRRPAPARAGKPWKAEEDTVLAGAFDEGRSVAEISRLLDRSSKAVRIRLVKLGRLSPDEAPAPRSRREPTSASTG